MNYAALLQQIQDTTQNNDPTFITNIPGFVRTAERMIYMESQLPGTRKNATGVTVIGSRSVTLPTDYIYMKAVEITTATGVYNLLPKAAEFLTELYPLAATQAQPKYYAHYDSTTYHAETINVAPTPDLVYTVGFHYFAVPTSIVTASTTWLGDNFDQVLLYATILQAYIFMKGSADIMAYYKAAYDVGLSELKAQVQNIKMDNFR
jgi:hypothetical protein